MDYDVLIFDLGGVIVDFAGVEAVRDLMVDPPQPVEVRRRWIGCETIRAFELGRIDAREFGDRFVDEWRLQVSRDSFLAHFAGWNRRVLPGAAELLDALRPHARLACLSNSNALHWESNARMGALGLFDAAFSSHQLGLYKPDRAIFERVLDELGAPASRALFFDDGQGNVEGARRAGLDAHCVAGVEALRARLKALGLPPGATSTARPR